MYYTSPLNRSSVMWIGEYLTIQFLGNDVSENIPGIHEMVMSSLKDCEIDIRPTLFRNIVVSGGNSMFPGKYIYCFLVSCYCY